MAGSGFQDGRPANPVAGFSIGLRTIHPLPRERAGVRASVSHNQLCFSIVNRSRVLTLVVMAAGMARPVPAGTPEISPAHRAGVLAHGHHPSCRRRAAKAERTAEIYAHFPPSLRDATHSSRQPGTLSPANVRCRSAALPAMLEP